MDTASAADLRQETLDADISKVLVGVRRSLEMFKPLNSPHEGYACIKQHLDRLWSTVTANSYRPIDRKIHAYHMSAAAIRYIVRPDPSGWCRRLLHRRTMAAGGQQGERGHDQPQAAAVERGNWRDQHGVRIMRHLRRPSSWRRTRRPTSRLTVCQRAAISRVAHEDRKRPRRPFPLHRLRSRPGADRKLQGP